jgi:ankyrin
MSIVEAIDSGDVNEVVRMLGEHPMLLEASTGLSGGAPLIYAAARGKLEILKVLIGKGANIHATTTNADKTALHFAARGGHEEVAAYLLENGAQVEQQDRGHYTPLMYASEEGHVRVVLLLLEHMGGQAQGLEVTDAWYSGRTALHWAVAGGHEEVVTALLRHGARADTRDRSGKSAIMTSLLGGELKIMGLLVDHLGTQALQERDGEGRSLLHIAIGRENCYRREDAVPYLLSEGLVPNLRDNQGETALMYAAMGISTGPDMEIMQTLLDYMGGEGLDERNNEGWTALHFAVNHGRPANVRALLVAGADPTIMDNQGRTPREIEGVRYQNQCAASFSVSKKRTVPFFGSTDDTSIVVCGSVWPVAESVLPDCSRLLIMGRML